MSGAGPDGRESGLETIISWVLLTGLAVSMALELAGIVLYWRAYGGLMISQAPSAFINGRNFFSFVAGQLRGRTGDAPSLLMIAGIVVLLLTPYVRVILSVAYFAWEKNLRYVLITLVVLAALTASMLLH
jgi:uncharacterized membrane protein